MKLLPLASLALAALLPAQNSNEKAPTVTNALEFVNGSALKIGYRQFTLAGGRTMKALSGGSANAETLAFYNDTYIPHMLAGSLRLNANASIADVELEAGKYRFSFRLDEDTIWNLDIYTDTGKKTIGEGFDIEKGWWKQEKKVTSIALDTKETGEEKVQRLVIQLVAEVGSDEPKGGEIKVAFGPLAATVSFKLGKPQAQAAEASAKKTKGDG